MTDLLIHSDDTGEIPPPAPDREDFTRNLAPFVADLPPALRRPLVADPPMPAPKPGNVQIAEEVIRIADERLATPTELADVPAAGAHRQGRGRHRKPAGPVARALAAGWARVRGAM